MASISQFLQHPWQLVASLWDSPPAIQPPLALPSGVPAPASGTVLVTLGDPGSLCGWVTADAAGGATRTLICQAFGQNMPAVVFLASSALFLVTLYFLVRYAFRARSALQAMGKLSLELEDAPSSAEIPGWTTLPASERVLKSVRSWAKLLPPLSLLANRIESARFPRSSIFDERAAGDSKNTPVELVALRSSITELSGSRRGLDEWTGRQLADHLPGWLSAMGLLTTFVAILLGLRGVQISSDMEVVGISSLVNGLSGKFFSSIVALGCAVSVSVVNHFVGNRLSHSWSLLLHKLERALPHLSVELTLLELLKKMKP